MSGLPIALLIFLTIAILLRMDLLFYLVYVLTGIYALAPSGRPCLFKRSGLRAFCHGLALRWR